ncbi:ferritin-like domain-containing protein [Clostridium ljungdahlii]|uniref:ferritin-like domain-containing protein n=1 Tax=Clostridium ljungdahlii TaxID=1538 RepID=UPI0038659D79
MKAYCDSLDLDGFSNFFKVQIEEKNYHISKFYDFKDNARILIGSIDSPDNNYDSINDVFNKSTNT